MGSPQEFEDFLVSPNDPLAEEHAAVKSWIDDSLSSYDRYSSSRTFHLKDFPNGKILLAAKPDKACQIVLAAIAQVNHWDRLAKQERASTPRSHGENLMAKWTMGRSLAEMSANILSGQSQAIPKPNWKAKRGLALMVADALMRRSLPFQKPDLLALIAWCQNEDDLYAKSHFTLNQVTKALERYASEKTLDEELIQAIAKLASFIRDPFGYDKNVNKLADSLDRLPRKTSAPAASAEEQANEVLPVPLPSPAGSPRVLAALKRHLKIPFEDDAHSSITLEPDHFPLADESPLKSEHELLSILLREAMDIKPWDDLDLSKYPTGIAILALEPPVLGRYLLTAAERFMNAALNIGDPAILPGIVDRNILQAGTVAQKIVEPLTKTNFELSRDELFDLILFFASIAKRKRDIVDGARDRLIAFAEREAAISPLTEGERYVLWFFRRSLLKDTLMGVLFDWVVRLSKLIRDDEGFYLSSGEPWSDAANEELSRMNASRRELWIALLSHALTATGARPSKKWLKAASEHVEAIGADEVSQTLARWFSVFARGQSVLMADENAVCLRGFLWLVPDLPDREKLLRLAGQVALTAYKNFRNSGPFSDKAGNAAIYAISATKSMCAVALLAMLKVRIKYRSAQREIEKAFASSAKALSIPREEIEEMGVPSYGLEEVGFRREEIGGYRAEIAIARSRPELKWFDSAGKPMKSVPAKVKNEHAGDWKELQQSLKDIQTMLPAQRDRVESFLLQRKRWRFNIWRERYLDHPLIGAIARRLIWRFSREGKTESGIYCEGRMASQKGDPLNEFDEKTEVELWHPLGCPMEEVLAWRSWLEDREIQQPFKQAYREVYLLTEAERNTEVYSNRFAAHILRQGQMQALVKARGWKATLLGPWDGGDQTIVHRLLDSENMRAEFWVNAAGEYGEEGAGFLYAATDQARFYRLQNADSPMPLNQVPPLVFSEIMRDIDLFVGVASVGNDPTWQDGGPDGRFRDYWLDFAFGELSETAATRKQALERLVPRLKIAPLCSFRDRFLVVQGTKRTYKIHVGSGNILMEPNDQYLCIVPDARAKEMKDNLFLPFEGDNTLSIILSKALLLAEDHKIKDSTILRQIESA